jgi:hypothetical protein
MIFGSITINDVTDRELRQVLEIKIKNEASLTFNPAQLQLISKPMPDAEQRYNNMVLGWRDRSGLNAVNEVLRELGNERDVH